MTRLLGRTLKNFSLFSSLDTSQLQTIASFFTREIYEANSYVININDNIDRLYFVESGSIQIYATSKSDVGQSLFNIYAGDIYPLQELFGSSPFKTIAKAIEPTTVLTISMKDFESIMQHYPSLNMHIISMMQREINAYKNLIFQKVL
ncbi:cyclic nucleotide-binding domain-containing protein [Bacillus salinus]|uniref:cyclic nucleotide-binding domain-containing protein n=1 Tax=Bacillus sp. HMF5848 TaxID=2495421 RepID=UPI00163AE268|nr:cyclic nucleotide-binding domain-containing protein [Bacillus sp. HMF5848]